MFAVNPGQGPREARPTRGGQRLAERQLSLRPPPPESLQRAGPLLRPRLRLPASRRHPSRFSTGVPGGVRASEENLPLAGERKKEGKKKKKKKENTSLVLGSPREASPPGARSRGRGFARPALRLNFGREKGEEKTSPRYTFNPSRTEFNYSQ